MTSSSAFGCFYNLPLEITPKNFVTLGVHPLATAMVLIALNVLSGCVFVAVVTAV